MSLRVLLADPDVDELAELSAVLQARGFTVALANTIASALDRARDARPNIVLAASSLCGPGALLDQLRADPKLASLPVVILVHLLGGNIQERCISRSDIEGLVAAIAAAPVRDAAPESIRGELRGDLSQVSLTDVLQMLAMNRRTGALSVSTAAGAGEIRLHEGDVVDAVYRRLEGEKALYRLLGERLGTFAFVPGGEPALKRVDVSTSMLLIEAMRRLDEVSMRMAELAPGGDALVATGQIEAEAEDLERYLFDLLQSPRALDELLDEVDALDLELLEALKSMMGRGLIRRIPRAALMTALASPEKLPILRALVSRLARDGFAGPPTLMIAGRASRLFAFAQSALRIEDALPSATPKPISPVPHRLATLRFGESVELAVTGLPLAAPFTPLWSLALPGTAAVVRLDDEPAEELEAACAAMEIPVLYASALLGWVDESDPPQVAALIRATLETVGGG